jgi:MSHA pilin protein MshD
MTHFSPSSPYAGRRLCYPHRESGVTLVELVITIVIISVAIAGVVGAFSLIVGRSADPLNQSRAVELAQLYMDEIITKKYDDSTPEGGMPKADGPGLCNLGPEGGESRATFDDVDDYHELSNQPPAGADGSLNGYSGFSVSVTISCDGTALGLDNDDGKRIDLAISAPGGQNFSFSAYRANF